MALFMLLNTEKVTHYTFRWLVFGVFFSLFYDLVWFGLKASEYSSDTKTDGGMQKKIRKFSLYMSYVSFFLRIIVALVYWKASLDFDQII